MLMALPTPSSISCMRSTTINEDGSTPSSVEYAFCKWCQLPGLGPNTRGNHTRVGAHEPFFNGSISPL